MTRRSGDERGREIVVTTPDPSLPSNNCQVCWRGDGKRGQGAVCFGIGSQQHPKAPDEQALADGIQLETEFTALNALIVQRGDLPNLIGSLLRFTG